MSTDVYVVSGFLGAGKTTLIQKLLKESFQNKKVVLIENDFGEISVDAALLKSTGVEVKEINSGCICCSLQGDFRKAIAEIGERYHPDQIIIEPSGIAKLSDVMKSFTNQRIPKNINLKAKITVVDATCCQGYIENFGEFYSDQIENADVILLSRSEAYSHHLNEVCHLLKTINPNAVIFSEPWSRLSSEAILFTTPTCLGEDFPPYPKCSSSEHRLCDHDYNHNNHPSCTHDHAAADIFDTITIYTQQVFTIEDLNARIRKMEEIFQGKVLRIKGIIHGVNGYLNLQYVPGDLQITETISTGGFLNVIGSGLDKQELPRLFT